MPPSPPAEPLLLGQRIAIDGAEYDAYDMGAPSEDIPHFYLVRGFPPRFLRRMLTAAQASEAYHAWRVDRQRGPDEVDEEILEKATARFQRDVDEYGNHFVAFVAQRTDGSFEVVGGGGVRRLISATYESAGWTAIGRLLIVPEVRGRGLAVHGIIPFFALTQTFAGPPAIGTFMGTETEQTRRLFRRAMDNKILDIVPAATKVWAGEHEVEIFLAFYPRTREWMRDHCAAARASVKASAGLGSLLDLTDQALSEGYDVPGGRAIGTALAHAEQELLAVAHDSVGMALYADFLLSARAMGTFG